MTEPPKPRLITFNSGKSAANDFQCSIDELPMKSTAPFGGGFVRSDASNAAMLGSQYECGVTAAQAMQETKVSNSDSRTFMMLPGTTHFDDVAWQRNQRK